MSGPISAAPKSTFARNNDFFFYKRFRDVTEFTEASSLGAALTLCGTATMFILFILELVAYLTVSAHQELVLAPHSSEPVRGVCSGGTVHAASWQPPDCACQISITFNVTFPSLSCDLLTLDARDAVGTNLLNVTKNVHKYNVDGATGRALLRIADHAYGTVAYGDEEADFHSDDHAEPPPAVGAVSLSDDTFESFVKSSELAMVAFGASWCPWSRRLAPVWEEVASVVASVPGVRLGKADCASPSAIVTCMKNHVAAYPTVRAGWGWGHAAVDAPFARPPPRPSPHPQIILFKGGDVHSHVHYHGDRTAQALLDYLVAAQADDSLVTNPTADPAAQEHAEAMARQLGILPKDHADHVHGAGGHAVGEGAAAAGPAPVVHDPADPGRAWKLIEAVHRAGLTAPGDAARAAAAAAAAAASGSNGSANGSAPAAGGSEYEAFMAAKAAEAAAAAPPTPAPRPVVGCMIAGALDVKRVPGVLAISFGGQGMSVPAGSAATLNSTHVVHELFFGKRVSAYQLSRLPAGTEGELHRMRGHAFVAPADSDPHAFNPETGAIGAPPTLHEHFLSVVGSSFGFGTGYVVDTFRYTANSHSYPTPPHGSVDHTLPLVQWRYELSPIAMVITEARRPFYHFATQVCAIVGGVFTVIGLVDSLLHGVLAGVLKTRIGKQA